MGAPGKTGRILSKWWYFSIKRLKKDIARENPDKVGVFTVLYGRISATDFVDVNRSFSLYVRF